LTIGEGESKNGINLNILPLPGALRRGKTTQRQSQKLTRENNMQLSVTGQQIDVTDSLRNYVSSKIDKIERHFDLVSDIHCILKVEKLRHTAEATVSVNGGKIFADSTEDDMYAAIDGLVDKLDRQVRKYKEKMVDHHARETHKRNFA
jgi:putative sigma-54 modulation protein